MSGRYKEKPKRKKMKRRFHIVSNDISLPLPSFQFQGDHPKQEFQDMFLSFLLVSITTLQGYVRIKV